jgi:hypothetical protein
VHCGPNALDDVLARWRAQATDGQGEAWFAAEDALGDAITATARHDAQQAVLAAMYELFLRRPGRSGHARSLDDPGSDASTQYVATAALLALLVRDSLAPETVNTLYAPFEDWLPLATLGACPAPTRAPEQAEPRRQTD